MICAGLDIGSRTTKLVMFNSELKESVVIETGVSPLERCQELLSNRDYERLVVTGYGRHLVAPALGAEVVSEIKAYALGTRYLYADCRMVIDIGGQDSKAISLSDSGDILKFEMNDRCAAGTGKFLEVMANTLEVNIQELGNLALSASRIVHINSLCTVFAESEVVSLIARGEKSSTIALALHEAISNRLISMIRRVGIKEKVVFAGGGALNKCLHHLLEQKTGVLLTIPPQPQIVGALGAAILAQQHNGQSKGTICKPNDPSLNVKEEK